MSETMVVVGVLARVASERRAAFAGACAELPGVTVFAVAGADRLGLLVEAPDLETAHALLRTRIDSMPGLLGTWPVAVEMDQGDTTQTKA